MLLPNLLHTAICYKRLQTLSSAKLGEYKFPELLILKSGIFGVSQTCMVMHVSGYLVVAGIVAN